MAERKRIVDDLIPPKPKGGESDAVRKRIRKGQEGYETEGQRREEKVVVTAVESGRSSTHVFIEGRFPSGKAAYFQMVPVKDFNKKTQLGRFDWSTNKVIDV